MTTENQMNNTNTNTTIIITYRRELKHELNFENQKKTLENYMMLEPKLTFSNENLGNEK